MLKKISAIVIILVYSLTSFGESFADLLGAKSSSQISISKSLQNEQVTKTAQIQGSSEHSSGHHSDCADSKTCHHCSSCFCGFALVDSKNYIHPSSSDGKNIQYANFYLSISLSGPQRPPQV